MLEEGLVWKWSGTLGLWNLRGGQRVRRQHQLVWLLNGREQQHVGLDNDSWACSCA